MKNVTPPQSGPQLTTDELMDRIMGPERVRLAAALGDGGRQYLFEEAVAEHDEAVERLLKRFQSETNS